jgi:hypothetical protein
MLLGKPVTPNATDQRPRTRGPLHCFVRPSAEAIGPATDSISHRRATPGRTITGPFEHAAPHRPLQERAAARPRAPRHRARRPWPTTPTRQSGLPSDT